MRAVYPGTFDPFTNGHLDVARRSRRLFDQLIVAVAEGGSKSPLFSFADRVQLAAESLKDIEGVKVVGFKGTLVDFLEENDAGVVLRGLRSSSDFDYESQMALFNRKLKPELETVFIVSSPEFAAVSSGLVREVAAMGRNIDELVPLPVKIAVAGKFGDRSGT
jgi:pantetheine-phosphate adenylyltransferase